MSYYFLLLKMLYNFIIYMCIPFTVISTAFIYFKMSYDIYKYSSRTLLNNYSTNYYYSYEYYKNSDWRIPLTFSIIYLLIVLNGKYLMQNSNPKNINTIMLWYNLYQCIVNGITVYVMVENIINNPDFNLLGNMSNNINLSYWVWLHYANKYIELLDTMFMILRKKFNQVSFLHCYHHVLLIWAWFLVIKVNPGGDSYFGAMINSFIHVIMYAYYSMPIIGIKVPLFIKKMITNCQKLQFCVCLSHSIYVIYDGKLPIILPLTQAFVMINMLILFTQFSRKTYGKIKEN